MPGRKKARGKSGKKKAGGKKTGKGKKGVKGKAGKDKTEAPPKKTPEGFIVPKRGSAGEASLFLFRAYVAACLHVKATPVPGVIAMLRQLIEEDKTTDRIILEEPSSDVVVPVEEKDSDGEEEEVAAKGRKAPPKASRATDGSDEEGSDSESSEDDDDTRRHDSIVRRERALWPLLLALEKCRYRSIDSLHVWSCNITDQAAAILSRHIRCYGDEPLSQLKTLDMVDCTMTPWAGRTLVSSFKTCYLQSLCLDYLTLGTEGCRCLCTGLRNTYVLKTLSLDHCGFKSVCGALLGDLLIHSAITDLSLEGNSLECAGACSLLRPFVDTATPFVEYKRERTVLETAVTDHHVSLQASRNPYARQDAKEEREEAPCEVSLKEFLSKVPPPPPPNLKRLVLAGTALDKYAKGGNQGPPVLVELLKRLLTSWEPLQELYLHNNRIGDYAGCELLEGLERRKEIGLKAIYITVTPHILMDTLKAILKISAKAPAGGGKKKKKGKKGRSKSAKGKGGKKKKKKKK